MLSNLSNRAANLKSPGKWSQVTDEELREVRGVCLDIDDTLSTEGKLTATAYGALWDLRQAGFAVVPVTGRPAGWCDHFARFWPVDAVVGENGAFTFFMQSGIRKRLLTPAQGADTARAKLDHLRSQIQKAFPEARWASDQLYREFDLAVDICEDVPPWSADEVKRLLAFCEQAGAHAKLSSIHVNIWFGDYDKRSGFEFWLKEGLPGWSGAELNPGQWLYIGDSPNDEPMFASFPLSVGVANLKKYLPLDHSPTWLTDGASGNGFVEMADRLIRAHSRQLRSYDSTVS